jgi:hypothetical protein
VESCGTPEQPLIFNQSSILSSTNVSRQAISTSIFFGRKAYEAQFSVARKIPMICPIKERRLLSVKPNKVDIVKAITVSF